MLRDQLEPKITSIIAGKLADPDFLMPAIDAYFEHKSDPDSGLEESLQEQIKSLKNKRERILESFFDGTIVRNERDSFLAKIDSQIAEAQNFKPEDPRPPAFTSEQLAGMISVFQEFPLLSRDDKRSLLSTMLPEIFVYSSRRNGSEVKGVTLRLSCESANRSRTAKSRSAGRPEP